MPIFLFKSKTRPRLEFIERFKGLPTSILSDAMNRLNSMDAGIKPIQTDIHMVGVALTIKSMAADNLTSHHAISYYLKKGDVLVIDAGGYLKNSVWGYLQTKVAMLKGAAGIVIDGVIRDLAEIRKSPLPVFCRGAVPAGPHKGWGGNINDSIQCGGTNVAPGDFIIGDDDGVVVIPQKMAENILKQAQERLSMEKQWFAAIKKNQSTVDLLNLKKDTIKITTP